MDAPIHLCVAPVLPVQRYGTLRGLHMAEPRELILAN